MANVYQQEVARALDGNYDPELVSDSPLKLRMHIRKLNDEFAVHMARKGHSKVFLTVEGKVDREYARFNAGSDSILEWNREIYRDSRGAELPGTVNPTVLENMFRQQSKSWEIIAKAYVQKAKAVVLAFNTTVFEQMISDEDLRAKLRSTLSEREQMTYSSISEQLSIF